MQDATQVVTVWEENLSYENHLLYLRKTSHRCTLGSVNSGSTHTRLPVSDTAASRLKVIHVHVHLV